MGTIRPRLFQLSRRGKAVLYANGLQPHFFGPQDVVLPIANHHGLLFRGMAQLLQHGLDDLRLVCAGAVQLGAHHHLEAGQHLPRLQDGSGEHLRLGGGQTHHRLLGQPLQQRPHPGVELVLVDALAPVALPVLLHRREGLLPGEAVQLHKRLVQRRPHKPAQPLLRLVVDAKGVQGVLGGFENALAVVRHGAVQIKEKISFHGAPFWVAITFYTGPSKSSPSFSANTRGHKTHSVLWTRERLALCPAT